MATDSLDVKEDLCKYLQVIDSGKFATSGPVTTANNPGLFVEGIGKVGLPLSDRDAADLSRVSHEAPFGKGSETFVDPNVRKTWELNPNQFELRNPAWPSTLQKVVAKVAQDLGVVDGASSVRAELHKMLLYEPGAFFEKHRDTEKAPGMFATLVIALPSEHTGGDVVVQLRDEKQILKTQGVCDFGYSYLAWYADVNHSVTKVKSGHRLVLTYNLMHQESNSSRVASILDNHRQNLGTVLAAWHQQNNEDESPFDCVCKQLVYILEHEYSEANICLDQLKGKDQLQMRYLLEACQDQDFSLFFAHIEYSQSGSIEEEDDDRNWGNGGPGYHELIDEFESKWSLPTVFQYNGKQIAEDVALEEEDILETFDFTNIEPDDEECDGWTGNEGCTATHIYHRTCAVILPRACRLDFLSAAGNVDVKEYVDTLLREIQDKKLSTTSREELRKYCEMVIDAKKKPPKPRKYSYSFSRQEEEIETEDLLRASNQELALIGKASLRLDQPDLLEKAARVTTQIAPLDLFQELGKGLIEHDVSLWQNGIITAMSRIPTLSERAKALDLLVSNYREAAKKVAVATQDIQDFKREIAMSITMTESGGLAVTAVDAQILLQLSEKYGEQYTYKVILPFVKKNISNLNFTVAFLTALMRAGNDDRLRLEAVRHLFKDVLSDAIPEFYLHRKAYGHEQAQNKSTKRVRLDYDSHGPPAAVDQSSSVVSVEDLATLFDQCNKLGLLYEIDQLSDKIISQTPKANTMTFEGLLLPLLKQIPPPGESASNSISTSTHSYAKLARTVVSSYINNYVQTPPQKPVGYERQPRGCSSYCEDCVSLDAFLKSSDRYQTRFSVNGKRRDHIEERLKQSYCLTATIRDGTPYTLVVEKTGREWENAMKEWKQRYGVALKAVEDIGFEKLKGLVGEEWEDMVGLRAIRADSGEEDENKGPLGDLAQGKGMSGAVGTGVDRKIGPEIIDLSCE